MTAGIEGINQSLENTELDSLLDSIDANGEKYRDFATALMEGKLGYKFTISHRTRGKVYESEYKALGALSSEYEHAFQEALACC